ncbi:hypothetical protein EDB19DRAFT_1915438 [Suillus lakei]|nr:hypothetical protein EDB19DRAFT_1915438 [Suillus lakei]
MTWPNNPSVIGAPLISSAPSTIVFCIAAKHILKHAPQHSPQAADSFMQDAFTGAANHLHINHVPWHVVNTGARSHHSRKPSLPTFSSMDSLPDEFTIDHIDIEEGKTELLNKDIYEWVFNNFDICKPIHKIALLASIYISKILSMSFQIQKTKPPMRTQAPQLPRLSGPSLGSPLQAVAKGADQRLNSSLWFQHIL